MRVLCFVVFFFQAEDGIRDLVRSRGLGDVYKRQAIPDHTPLVTTGRNLLVGFEWSFLISTHDSNSSSCLLYTSDAADERSSVDLGGRRIIKKKTQISYSKLCTD